MRIILILFILLWIYILSVLYRSKNSFFYYLVGSVGLFTFSMIIIEPFAVPILQKNVAAVAGVIGDLTGIYSSYFNSGILFISHNATNLSLFIDFECSGVIEIIAFISLLAFFGIYDIYERVIIGFVGTIMIFVFNVLRIFIICISVYIGGMNIYFVAHTIIGRLFFYVCTVFLYFYVFTKSQIIRQKLGGIKHDNT
ncbi:MAG: exosortase family protein XrtG [Saccharofermentans sp.]|nr:exosortase family protein XrtG [Saccharofermentans sp.]